jgi:uncharacterized protein YciI
MYALIVNFIKPVDIVTPHIPPHAAWVKKYFDKGLFLAAGPKTSGLGGVILTKPIDKKMLMQIIAEDPYVIEDVADYQVVEFNCKATSPELVNLKTLCELNESYQTSK